jgi:hypothetical protein
MGRMHHTTGGMITNKVGNYSKARRGVDPAPKMHLIGIAITDTGMGGSIFIMQHESLITCSDAQA